MTLKYYRFNQRKRGQFALLLDPDKISLEQAIERSIVAELADVDLLLIGGTKVPPGAVKDIVQSIKEVSKLPLILFPGADPPERTLVPNADGFFCPIVLTSSLYQFVAGWHKEAIVFAKQYKLRSYPITYILVEDSVISDAARFTESDLVPKSSPEFAARLAATGEMMGSSLIYLEAGSGAMEPVSLTLIREVRATVQLPLIVGGGIRTPEAVAERVTAGANMVVVGDALEKRFDQAMLKKMVNAAHDNCPTNSHHG